MFDLGPVYWSPLEAAQYVWRGLVTEREDLRCFKEAGMIGRSPHPDGSPEGEAYAAREVLLYSVAKALVLRALQLGELSAFDRDDPEGASVPAGRFISHSSTLYASWGVGEKADGLSRRYLVRVPDVRRLWPAPINRDPAWMYWTIKQAVLWLALRPADTAAIDGNALLALTDADLTAAPRALRLAADDTLLSSLRSGAIKAHGLHVVYALPADGGDARRVGGSGFTELSPTHWHATEFTADLSHATGPMRADVWGDCYDHLSCVWIRRADVLALIGEQLHPLPALVTGCLAPAPTALAKAAASSGESPRRAGRTRGRGGYDVVDAPLVEEAVQGVMVKKWTSALAAAEALEMRTQGASPAARVDRLQRKISAALKEYGK